MSQREEIPQEVEFSERRKLIEDLRRNPIIRAGSNFKLTNRDIAPTTWLWRFLFFLMASGVGYGLLWLLSWPLGALALSNESYNDAIRIVGATLMVVLPAIIASGAYATHYWAAWGIARGGKIFTVRGPGWIWKNPFVESVRGILDIRERTMYVPANQSIMRGLRGQSVIRVSLNAVVTYKPGKEKRDRVNLFNNVTEADVSLYMRAEGTVSTWMRENPFTALITTTSLKQMLDGVARILNDFFPNQQHSWYRGSAERVLNAILLRPEMVRLTPTEVAEPRNPGIEMMKMLQEKIEDWGFSIAPFDLPDIEMPPRMARFFERSEAIDEMLANIMSALTTQFPNQTEAWYRDAALAQLDNLIIYAEGERPDILRILRDGKLEP
jgi:hypothetical protein